MCTLERKCLIWWYLIFIENVNVEELNNVKQTPVNNSFPNDFIDNNIFYKNKILPN